MKTRNYKLQLLVLLTTLLMSHIIYAQDFIKTPQEVETELKTDLPPQAPSSVDKRLGTVDGSVIQAI